MTNREIAWLAKNLPPEVIKDISARTDEAATDWSLPNMPKQCIFAAQLVAIEFGMIQFGALKKLGRAPA